jgi:hypothetical protein
MYGIVLLARIHLLKLILNIDWLHSDAKHLELPPEVKKVEKSEELALRRTSSYFSKDTFSCLKRYQYRVSHLQATNHQSEKAFHNPSQSTPPPNR